MRLSVVTACCAVVAACGDEGEKKNAAPVASIIAPSADATIDVGSSLTFEGACSDADDDALSHHWDFDGGAAEVDGLSPGAVVFASTGTFEVVYTCSDDRGATGSASTTVTVVEAANQPPVAEVVTPGTDVTVGLGLAVVFSATCTDPEGLAVTHAWDFDGAALASTVEDPGSIDFATVGAYEVTYRCSDAAGGESSPITRVITVVPPPDNRKPVATVDGPAADVSVAVGSSLRFEASCTDPDGDAVHHAWAFDGLTADSTVEDPGDVVAMSLGVYEVSYTCTDSEDNAADPVTRTVTVTPPSVMLEGTITFDRVRTTSEGLDYSQIATMAARRIDVMIVDAADGETLIAETTTDDDGRYSVAWDRSKPSEVIVTALARVAKPLIEVRNNTNAGALYGTAGDPVDAATTTTADLHLSAGWTGDGYDGARAAAPFAVLDAAYSAARAFLDVRDVVFADLVLYWSVDNSPTEPGEDESDEEARAAGHIGTSHWNKTALWILGTEDVDADEFDDHVIVHEWGHYFESKMSRSDSPGGTHGLGDIKDPRLALGEGWGNAISAIIFWPETDYIDTSGERQATSFVIAVDDNSADTTPGWFSEASAQSIILDLFDPADVDEPFDAVELGVGPLYDVLTGPEKEGALTTMFSLIAALKESQPDAAAAIDTLTLYNGVFGVPVADAYGTGETNDGGFAGNLPVFNTFASGEVELTLGGGGLFNELEAIRYIRFEGDGGAYVFTTTTSDAQDVDLEVRRRGEVVHSSYTVGDELTEPFQTEGGVEYVVIVLGLGTVESYTTTVTLEVAP